MRASRLRLVLLSAFVLAACSEQARARRDLSRRGIPITPAELTARAKAQDFAVVEELLLAGLSEDEGACTVALCVAARLPDARIVAALAAAGADVKTRQGSLEGYSVLMSAAEAGQAGNVVALAAAGADPNATAGLQAFRMTALHLAAAHGDVPTIEALLSAGARPDALAEWMGDRVTALHLAAARGDVGAIDALVSGGADVNAPSRDGRTPASAARDNGKDAASSHIESLRGH